MIRRLLSLVCGGVACWALYVLVARFGLNATPTDLILGAVTGMDGFMQAVVPALIGFAGVWLLLSRIPFVKRGWMTAGALLIAGVVALFAMVFFGGGQV